MAKFEENLTALETVVERLERGDLSLEDSVKLFEQGVALSAACKVELDAAEGKIQILLDRDGQKGATADVAVEDSPLLDEEDEE
ncbi:exodeoxyribonuclease VII small subunit [Granulicella aggregans]|jgi:exodeoxyribonuclease VII small subunit|uniref:exodeoxyribonuclease VII small subunit n=1 Tax=Granulicella aggregans TaxID=474949 RepID=UPI0021DF6650|nr:exodeoxyribonuclease VII small subunit [Granulicella aggregans]